ncbi:MAG TPA: anti-sigma factor [Burkholderiales bacterium]|jgi:anti-sigma-K factor RskA|nr:anti-sigma factor [Burkholderiales bacterium]
MNYRNKPELIERLAAEYVLGTLAGGARRRFAAWMVQDAALRRSVGEWETRLTPMAAAVGEAKVPASLWPRIAGSIAPQKQAAAGWWESLAFWRSFGLGASAIAAALAVFIGMRPPQVVEHTQVVEHEVVKPVRVSDGANPWQPSYVATLTDGTGKTMLMVYIGRKSDELWMKYEGEAMPTDASLELWGMDDAGQPKSLGLITGKGKHVVKLPVIADKSIAQYKALAVSMEPPGGSKTGVPSGPVMFRGRCHNFW